MKVLRQTLAISSLALAAQGNESALTTTYQPLDGLGAGRIIITEVVCHDYAPDHGSSIELISAKNVPPTNAPKAATKDLNLASICGVKFRTSDLGKPKANPTVTMDCSNFVLPPKRFDYPRKEILRACLECLRRCLPAERLNTPVTLKASNADIEWMTEVIREFNKHDRSKPFPFST